MFLDYLRMLVEHAATGQTAEAADRMDTLVFSILNIFDGTAGDLPGFTLTPCPHPDDAAFCREEGENWWPDDVDIADGQRHLHEMWAKKDWSDR